MCYKVSHTNELSILKLSEIQCQLQVVFSFTLLGTGFILCKMLPMPSFVQLYVHLQTVPLHVLSNAIIAFDNMVIAKKYSCFWK